MRPSDTFGKFMLALLAEAREMYPKDPQAQAKYVSRKVVEKRKADKDPDARQA